MSGTALPSPMSNKQAPNSQPLTKSAGVLPVPPAATVKGANTGSKNAIVPAGTQKLKTIVRRLPPGLSQDEFEAALGDDWKVGRGKISWASYRGGKVSKDLAKPSKPSRAYLQVAQPLLLDALAEKIKMTSFIDARKTDSDPVLLGPPVLEFAPCGRVPGGRKRNDARQGTIDQDPEFMQFLESLTNPVSKTPAADGEAALQSKVETNKVTPLILHLRQKKAAKEAAKEAKDKKDKGSKQARAAKADDTDAEAKSLVEKKGAKAAKSVVKATSKPVKKGTVSESQPPAVQPVQDAPSRRNANEGGNAAARMLQRDLGIKGRATTKKATRSAADEPVSDAAQKTATPKAPAAPATKNSNPAILKRADGIQANGNANANGQAPPPKTQQKPAQRPAKASTATQAFVRGVSAAQGMTDETIKSALAAFGAVKSVEVDRRKGFAYVEFAEASSLVKATSTGSVGIGSGSCQVLERRGEPKPSSPAAAAAPGGAATRGKGGRGRGGSAGSRRGGSGNAEPASAGLAPVATQVAGAG